LIRSCRDKHPVTQSLPMEVLLQRFLGLWGVLLSAFLLIQSAAADVLVLQNGDRVTGEILGLKDGTLQFKTSYAGALKVSVGKIAGLTSDKVVTVRFKSGGYGTGHLVPSYARMAQLRSIAGGFGNPIQIEMISEIYPGKEIQRGFKWSGRVNLGATKRSGNTDTRSLHIDAAIKGETEKDRLRFEGSLNKEFSGSERTQDDFKFLAQHDHILSKSLYFYTNVKFSRNEPQDLTLRASLGTGVGWQIIKSDKTNFAIEAGPAYVNENFDTAEDRDFVAGRWAVLFDHYLWKKFAQFFHRHEGIVDLENTGNVSIDSSTGLRFPLSNGFNLTTQADIDWDSEPAPGATSTDKKYLLTIGYSW